MSYELKIVKVAKGFSWAVKAIFQNKCRYRGFYYKKEAMLDMETWKGLEDFVFIREFLHNFNSAEELGLRDAEIDISS